MDKATVCQEILLEIMVKFNGFDRYYLEKLDITLFGERFCLTNRKEHIYYLFKPISPEVAESFKKVFHGQTEKLPMCLILKGVEGRVSLWKNFIRI